MCGGAQKSIVVEQYPGMTKDHEGQVRNSAGNEVVWGYRLAMNAKAKETRSSAPVRTVEVDDPFRRGEALVVAMKPDGSISGEFDRRYKQSDNAIPLHRVHRLQSLLVSETTFSGSSRTRTGAKSEHSTKLRRPLRAMEWCVHPIRIFLPERCSQLQQHRGQ